MDSAGATGSSSASEAFTHRGIGLATILTGMATGMIHMLMGTVTVIPTVGVIRIMVRPRTIPTTIPTGTTIHRRRRWRTGNRFLPPVRLRRCPRVARPTSAMGAGIISVSEHCPRNNRCTAGLSSE